MSPGLCDGDFVFARYNKEQRAAVDSIVVAKSPTGRVVIKRVRSRGESHLALGSDNPSEGTDSRHFGSIADADVIGVVSAHFALGRLLARYR